MGTARAVNRRMGKGQNDDGSDGPPDGIVDFVTMGMFIVGELSSSDRKAIVCAMASLTYLR